MIQLMEHGHEKPEVNAVSIDSNFSAYLYNDFLSVGPRRKDTHNVFLLRYVGEAYFKTTVGIGVTWPSRTGTRESLRIVMKALRIA